MDWYRLKLDTDVLNQAARVSVPLPTEIGRQREPANGVESHWNHEQAAETGIWL